MNLIVGTWSTTAQRVLSASAWTRTSSRTPIEAHKPVHPPVGVEAADRTGDVPLCEPFR
jgi:hypothetical protein